MNSRNSSKRYAILCAASFRGARLLASEPGIQHRTPTSGFRVRAEEARPGMTGKLCAQTLAFCHYASRLRQQGSRSKSGFESNRADNALDQIVGGLQRRIV